MIKFFKKNNKISNVDNTITNTKEISAVIKEEFLKRIVFLKNHFKNDDQRKEIFLISALSIFFTRILTALSPENAFIIYIIYAFISIGFLILYSKNLFVNEKYRDVAINISLWTLGFFVVMFVMELYFIIYSLLQKI